MFVRRILNNQECYELHSVTEVRSACETVQNEPIDVVLLDLNLPGSSGLKSIDLMRAAAPNIPVVAITGAVQDRMKEAAIERGATGLIDKWQLRHDVLVAAINHAVCY